MVYFTKKCWNLILLEFKTLCEQFCLGSINLQPINNSFITPILKKNDSETINDYRPILFLNCSIKLLTNLLANRLQSLMLSMVHANQFGFIKGRSIYDCFPWTF